MSEQAFYSENAADAGIESNRQLVSAIRETDEIISRVDELSASLAKRLEPIIAQRPEAASDSGENDRLGTVADRLRYLLDTVQV